MRAAQLGFQKPPAVKTNTEFEANREANSGHVEDLPDFTQLMQSSNAEKEKELAKEREATAGGQLNLGETKSDKEFREMLEKMTGKKQDKLKNKLDKDDYLNLMVTQLKHQDPTKPMDNQEMAQQLAQFNTVEQLMAANQTLQKMANSQAEAKIDKLSPFLGKTVQVGGNKLRMDTEGQVSKAHYDIPDDTSTLAFTIKDATGKVVRTDSQNGIKKGEHVYTWDGRDDKGNKMASGEYTISIDGTDGAGKPVKAKQTFTAKVTEITDLASGGKLGTTVGTIETKDILAIKSEEPTAAAVAANAKPVAAAPAPAAANAAPAVADAQKPAAPVAAENAADAKPDQNAKVESKLAEHKARRKAAAEAKKAAAAAAAATAPGDAAKVTEAAPAATTAETGKVVEEAAEKAAAPAATTSQPTASKKDAKTESAKTESQRKTDKSNEKKAA